MGKVMHSSMWFRMVPAAVLIILMSGCQMLGMASPFSSGADSFDRAKRAWSDNQPATALMYAASAVNRDEKHWPAYSFIITNYDEAIQSIEARLAELGQQDQTVETVREQVRILRDMMWFVHYVARFPGESTDPKIVEFKNDSVAIPLTDYETPLSEAQQQGYAIAFAEATTLFGSGEFEGAIEALQVITRDFVQGADERAAAEVEISRFLVETATPMVARLTMDNLEQATAMVAAARRFDESEEVAALTGDLNRRAVELIFAEADRIARPGTVAALENALSVAVQVRNYTGGAAGDDTTVTSRLVTYAQRLADLYRRDVDAAVAGARGNREANHQAEVAFANYVAFVHGWPSISGHERALEDFGAFHRASRTLVHVVLAEGHDVFRDRVTGPLADALAGQRGRDIWVVSSENRELAEERQRAIRGTGGGRWWSNAGEQAERLIYRDSSNQWLNTANRLTAASALEEARELNIDVLVRITADASAGSPRPNRRQDVRGISAYQKTDGTIHVDEQTVSEWRAARAVADLGGDAGMASYNRQLEEAGITRLWHEEPVTHTFQSLTAPVTVNYTIEVIRVSDGSSIHTSRFTHRGEETSDEVLVGITSAVPELQRSLQDQVREAPTEFRPSVTSVVAAGYRQLNMAPVATAIGRN